jgi:hypothetical protein
LTDAVRSLEEEKRKLTYYNAKLNDPKFLMELLRKPEFSYLKRPDEQNVQRLN